MGMRACAATSAASHGQQHPDSLLEAGRDRGESGSSSKRDGAVGARVRWMMLVGAVSTAVCLVLVSTGPGCAALLQSGGDGPSAGPALLAYCALRVGAGWGRRSGSAGRDAVGAPGSPPVPSNCSQAEAQPESVHPGGGGLPLPGSGWERAAVRSDAYGEDDDEAETLPEELRLSELELVNVMKSAYNAALGWPCGSPTAAMVDVQRNGSKVEGTVACPVFWHCNATDSRSPPKVAAICWDRRFHDLPFPATLPTEDPRDFNTPLLGEKTVKLNAEFRGAAVFMHNVFANARGQVFDSDYLFLKGGCGERMADEYLRNRSRIVRHEIVINLSHSLGNSHYHGLVELFSRFVILLPIIRDLPHVPVLVTTRDGRAFSEMLDLVASTSGVKNVNLTYMTRYYSQKPNTTAELVYADLMILAHNPVCGCTSGAVWDFIRQSLFRIPYTRDTPMERDDEPWYVVLGERSKTRGLVQHKEILAGLVSQLGEEKVKVFSDRIKWSKPEQKELFRGAAIFIGPHGAGMSNMVFMPFHASIIEVRPDRFSNPCYHCTADMLRFPYYRIDTPGAKGSNLTVDVDTVLSLVAAIVRAKGRSVPFYEPLTMQGLNSQPASHR